MHFIACDAFKGALCDVLGSRLRDWPRIRAGAHPDGRLRNEACASHGAPLATWLQARTANGLPTATANAAGNPGDSAATPSTAPTSTFEDAQPSTTNSGIVPAAIAVSIFVVCVLVALRIRRAIRLNRLVAAYAAEPETPRMWEVRLNNSPCPSFEGRWNEIMPFAAQRSTEPDTVSPGPLSRGMSVPTDASGTQASHRDSGDSSRQLLPSTVRRVGTIFHVDGAYGLPEQVAVLIAMPAPHWHASTQGRRANPVGPVCIGIVEL